MQRALRHHSPQQAAGTGAHGHDLSHLGRVHCRERRAPQVGSQALSGVIALARLPWWLRR